MAALAGTLLWLVILGESWAQREVTMQRGPLYRTAGTHISLWCKVSGHQGPANQTFEFSVSKPRAPETRVVSSRDPDFPYKAYSSRVQSRDIYLEQVSGDQNLLHIRHLQEDDAGEWECHTPNTDPQYLGSYAATTTLTVMPDTLVVSLGPRKVEVMEGAPLDLTCQVSVTSPQHTHLSVTWILSRERDTEIVGLSRDFVLVPGAEFSHRFQSGELRLDKLGEASYRLSIRSLHQSDQGDIICRAAQWIQDPGDVWTRITERSSQPSTVTVTPATESRQVTLSAQRTQLYEGDSVELSCQVTPPSPSISIGWFRLGAGQWRPVASIQRDGRLVIAEDYASAHRSARLQAEKRDSGLFTLTLREATEGDAGEYTCRVTEATQDGDPRNATAAPSNSARIHISRLESSLELTLMTRASRPSSGDTATLVCSAKASFNLQDHPVSWAWFLQPGSGPRGTFLNLFGENKDLSLGNFSSTVRGKAMYSTEEHRSTLTIPGIQRHQGGSYKCGATFQRKRQVGSQNPIFSNVVTINVQLPEFRLILDQSRRVVELSPGQEEAVVSCRIQARSPGTSLRVRWYCQLSTSGTPQEILRVNHEGLISPNPSFPGSRSQYVPGQTSSEETYLRILRPGPGQMGTYHCVLEEWLLEEEEGGRLWTKLGERPSGATRISLRTEDESLKLPKQNVSSAAEEGQDVVLRCPLQETPGTSSLFSISWFRVGGAQAPPRLLYRMGWDGTTELEESLASRLRLITPSRGNYSLVLQRVGQEDRGTYYCQAEEWRLQEGTWKMAAADQSGFLELRVSTHGDGLRVNSSQLTLEVPEYSPLTLPCPVVSVSVPGARLAVSWWMAPGPGAPESLLFNVSHTGEITYSNDEELLQYERPQELTFYLRILRSRPTDSGVYHCRVQEWLRGPAGDWKQRGECRGGNTAVTVQPAGSSSRICWSLSLFSSLVALSILIAILPAVLLVALIGRRKKGGRGQQGNNQGALWSSVKMSKIRKCEEEMAALPAD
ncbi:immunoglobulin superfamily member 3-like [Gastrophryne carolinensis]